MGEMGWPPTPVAAAVFITNDDTPAPWFGVVSADGSSGPIRPAILIVEWIAAVIFVVRVCSSSVFFLASSMALALASAASSLSFCLFHAAQLGPVLAPEFPPWFPFGEELLCRSVSLLLSFLDLLRLIVLGRRGDTRGERGLLARERRAPLGAVGRAWAQKATARCGSRNGTPSMMCSCTCVDVHKG